MQDCKSACRKNKTKLGYLCDKIERNKLTGKEWCRIASNDVDKYSAMLGSPNKQGNDYWDDVVEKTTGLCYNPDKKGMPQYSPCTLSDTFVRYTYGAYLMLFMAGGGKLSETLLGAEVASIPKELLTSAIKSIVHFQQTWRLSKMTDKQILLTLLDKLQQQMLDALSETWSKAEIDQVIAILRKEIEALKDKDQMGAFVKQIFRITSEVIRHNASPKYRQLSTPVMDFFVNHIPSSIAMEVLKGANFKVEDDGQMYEFVKNHLNGYGRFSTHAKNATDVIQYGSTDAFMDVYLHLLCGKFQYENGKVVSWCQFEGAPMPPGQTTLEVFQNIFDGSHLNAKFLQYYLDHSTDSLAYLILSKSIQSIGYEGYNLAIGSSVHTDLKPISVCAMNFNNDTYQVQQASSSSSCQGKMKYDLAFEPPAPSTETRLTPLKFEMLQNQFTYVLGIQSNVSSLFQKNVSSTFGTRGQTIVVPNSTVIREPQQQQLPIAAQKTPLISSYVPAALPVPRGGRYRTKKNQKKGKKNQKRRAQKSNTRKRK